MDKTIPDISRQKQKQDVGVNRRFGTLESNVKRVAESTVDLREEGLPFQNPTHNTRRDKGTEHINGQEHARAQRGLDVAISNILRVGGKFLVLEDKCHDL